MGGSQSKTEITQLSEQINNMVMSTMQSCEVASTQDQTVKDTNTGIWFWSTTKLEQQSEIRSDCFSSITKQTELQNNLINTISQAASTEGVAVLDAFSAAGSTASANLQNIIRNNITMSNIQKSYNQIKQSQSVTFDNSGIMGYRQVDLTQGSKIFAAATLNELSKSGVFNQIESYLDQTASTKLKNPLEFLVDLVGGITSGITSTALTMIFVLIMIVASPFILIAVAGKLMGNTSDNDIVYLPPGQLPPGELASEIVDESNTANEVMPIDEESAASTIAPILAPKAQGTPRTVPDQITSTVFDPSTIATVVNALNKPTGQAPVTN